ncbi:diguanylate cyclase (GGDEF)-like protein/PAS domain S-box-containing protein [Clostridium moniliforme]|uniref:Diguanylate cyclase (GGDEF)-like protein/PAS domain S-box-containing protein n=2 Tax=Clostridium moniliforme TaxID=39489 RepID=A0ABS4EXL3_9CLOT|nr:diguanylate cyclase (GGDEF)-like protein/PAS domain S-box-containing protein [Clostridium moniliforme]
MDFMKILLENIPFAIWETDNNGNLVIVNKKFCNIFNVDEEEVINNSLNDILEKQKIQIDLHKNLTEEIIFYHTIKNKPFEIHIVPIKQNNGIATIGIIIDKTKILELNKKILNEKNMLELIIDSIPEAIFYKDKNDKFLGCNKAFEKILDVDRNNIIGKGPEVLPYTEVKKDSIRENDKNLMKFGRVETVETEYINKIGAKKVLEDMKAPIRDKDNKIIGLVGVSREITQRKNFEDELKHLSYIDKLTGLYNRAFFDKKVNELKKEGCNCLSLIMGDLNGLKIINDSLGHFEGDRFLVGISNIVKEVIKEKGFAIRWGGDEIIILLPNVDKKDSIKMTNLIYRKCREANYKPVPLSISLGVATTCKSNKTIDDLILIAEKKLYKRKLLSNSKIREAILSSIKKNLDDKEVGTKNHNKRIIKLAKKLGEKLNLSQKQMEDLILVIMFHDVGKIGIPDKLLSKQEHLTKEEIELINEHTEKGYRIALSDPTISHIANSILSHHERWDGKGYPLGIKKENIPLEARIVYLLDSYDYMYNNEDNSKIRSKKECIEELKRQSGKKFDPFLTKELIKILEE